VKTRQICPTCGRREIEHNELTIQNSYAWSLECAHCGWHELHLPGGEVRTEQGDSSA